MITMAAEIIGLLDDIESRLPRRATLNQLSAILGDYNSDEIEISWINEFLSDKQFANTKRHGEIIENPNRSFGRPTHIMVDKFGREIPEEKLPLLGTVKTFFRSGAPPRDGFSIDYRENRRLAGVSAYMHPEAESFAGLQNREWYSGKGRMVGVGPDGEPLIEIIGIWKKYSEKIDKSELLEFLRDHQR